MKKLILINLIFINILFANSYIFESNNTRTNIIELYTSQGCNSCPPADEWLSKLKNDPKLFKEFIPMAFHVTYWNYIGWKDIFSKKENDNRQRNYSTNIWKKNAMYTPQFIVNTKEYREWFYDKSFPEFKNTYGGKLIVKLENDNLRISYENKNIKNDRVIVNIAVLGFDYNVKINRGENRNKALKHDFVVLEYFQNFIDIKKHTLKVDKQIDFDKNKKQALVVWLSDKYYNILQATGGYLEN